MSETTGDSAQSDEDTFRRQREREVLGRCLLSKDAIAVAVRILGEDPAVFESTAHRLLYASVVRLWKQNGPVDAIAVNEDLTAHGQTEEVGGPPYLHRIHEAGANSPVDGVEARARGMILGSWRIPDGLPASSGLLGDALPRALDRLEGKATAASNLSTGFSDLDELLTGLNPGTLTVIAGRPRAGKSVLLSNFARRSAIHHGLPTIWADLETPHDHLVDRILAAEAIIPLHILRSRLMNDGDWKRLAAAITSMAVAPLLLHTGGPADIDRLEELLDSAPQTPPVALLAVDSLQSMPPRTERETREREVSDNVRALKTLALERDLAVVATAQVNRVPLQRLDPRPTMDDLRESDLIAHQADTVILVERPDLYDRESPRLGEIDLVVAKQRSGPEAAITVAGQFHYVRFMDMAP